MVSKLVKILVPVVVIAGGVGAAVGISKAMLSQQCVPASAYSADISVSPTTITLGETATVTATLKTVSGIAVQGASVILKTWGSNQTGWATQSGATDTSGEAVFSVKPAVATAGTASMGGIRAGGSGYAIYAIITAPCIPPA